MTILRHQQFIYRHFLIDGDICVADICVAVTVQLQATSTGCSVLGTDSHNGSCDIRRIGS